MDYSLHALCQSKSHLFFWNTSQNPFENFPEELICQIFLYLGPQALASSAALVSKQWQRLSSDPQIWKIFCSLLGNSRLIEQEKIDYQKAYRDLLIHSDSFQRNQFVIEYRSYKEGKEYCMDNPCRITDNQLTLFDPDRQKEIPIYKAPVKHEIVDFCYSSKDQMIAIVVSKYPNYCVIFFSLHKKSEGICGAEQMGEKFFAGGMPTSLQWIQSSCCMLYQGKILKIDPMQEGLNLRHSVLWMNKVNEKAKQFFWNNNRLFIQFVENSEEPAMRENWVCYAYSATFRQVAADLIKGYRSPDQRQLELRFFGFTQEQKEGISCYLPPKKTWREATPEEKAAALEAFLSSQ